VVGKFHLKSMRNYEGEGAKRAHFPSLAHDRILWQNCIIFIKWEVNSSGAPEITFTGILREPCQPWQRSLLVLSLPVSMIQIDKPCTTFPPVVFAFSLSIFILVQPGRERKRIIQSYYFLWLTIQDIKLLPSQSHLPPFLESSFFCAYSLASRLSAMPAARISALLSPWYVTLHTQALAFGAIYCGSFIY